MKKGDIFEGKVIRTDFPNKGIVEIDGKKIAIKNASIYVDQIVFRKALIICQFSKSITNFPQLPTVWGEAITCRSSPTLRPDHFVNSLPRYHTTALTR